jgi:multidrug resistance efflux pump
VTGGVVTLGESDGSVPRVVAAVDANAVRPEDLVAAAAESVRKEAPVLLESDQTEPEGEPAPTVASVPLHMGEKAVGAIALELHQDSSESPQSVLSGLERVADKFAAALLTEVDQRVSADAARVLQFQATLLTQQSFLEAATALATELAKVLRLDHVAIGFRDGKYSRVEAVSNFADFEESAQVFRITSIAMDEAIEQGASVAYPNCVVCSIPIVDDGQAIGAVSIERTGETPFSMQEVAEYEQIMCIVGPVLELKRQSERPWQWRLKKSLSRVAENILGPGHVFAKSAAIAGVVLLAAGFLVNADYRVGAPARLEGSVQRALVAPADGYLEHAHVRPGDEVSAGQVLVELAREDLELERRKWQSELAQHENAAPAALARGDRSEFVISQALADEARAKLGLVEEQMARANVRSPFDGVVIMGDLTQSLGAPVRRGDMLVTVAPVNEFRLILEVDERDIADITNGQTGNLALGAMPGRRFDFEVSRISPVAEARDGRNFFEVEGELDESFGAMRPGLHGVARISVDERPIIWVLTHRLIDWVRIAAWSAGI